MGLLYEWAGSQICANKKRERSKAIAENTDYEKYKHVWEEFVED